MGCRRGICTTASGRGPARRSRSGRAVHVHRPLVGSVVLIAGGVGITPLMAKIRYLTDLSWPGDIYLVFSVKTERDIIFRDELDALRRRHPNLHVTVTLTARRVGWSGERGRITPALLARAVPGIATRRVHFVGRPR